MANLVVVRFFPKDGSAEAVERILRGMVRDTRQEPGCERYDLFQSTVADKRIYVLLERYRDTAALEAHRVTKHYLEYRANIMPLLAQPIEVTILENLDVRAPL
jgi:quinol monooxygenase YgiN